MDSAPVALDARTQEGQDYIAAMKLAGRYAYAGRDWVCDRVVKILGAKTLDSVHNHHNFAWQEKHGGKSLWVVRKGATPAFPGQRGFVGGTMGENSVILEGVENDDASLSLYSTIHGAGRVMGRMEAKGKRDKSTGEWKRPPKVTQEMMNTWVDEAKVELRGGGVDESPHCYKRLPEVLAEHSASVRVIHTLKPLGVAMAGKNEFDPFKD
jgi:tRNA-splicing ligase RtcB